MINRPDFEWRSSLIGEKAARLTRLSWDIWVIVGFPLLGVLLIGIIAVGGLHVPVGVFGPVMFIDVVLVLLAGISLPFVSIGIMRRASLEAGAYLNTIQYTGSNRVPVGVLQGRTSFIENYMLRSGIPPRGETDTLRTVIQPQQPSPTLGEGISGSLRLVRSISSAGDWRTFVAGFSVLVIGVLIAIVDVVLQILHLLAGPSGASSSGSLRVTLFFLAALFILIGAPIMYRALRRISSRHR